MEKKLIILAMAAGAMLGAYGKTFSLDLRSAGNGSARPRLAAAAQPRDDGTLRAFDLDAGVADVGAVAVGDELTFTLFDDVSLTLALREKMPSPLGGDAFIAEVAGYDGIMSAVVLRTSDGLTIDVQEFRSRKCYKVLSSHDGVKVRELEAKAGMCGGDSLRPSASADVKPSPRLQSSPSGQGDSCVDILVAYDKNAAAWAKSQGGGLTNFAQTAVQKMNYALSNTGLAEKFQFRLVGVVAVSASTNSLPAALNAATYGFSGWERIVARRDEVGADIVTVLIDTGSAYGTTGMGWSLRDEEYEWFSDYACNVCSIRAVAVSHTMTHEVGHNMGCGHSDIQESDPGPQLYAYSAGYYFSAVGEDYHTIMAYGTEGPGGAEVPYFSSPEHFYQGVAVGDADHDNTRTLASTFAEISKLRTATGEKPIEEEDEPVALGEFFGLEWTTSRSRPWTNYKTGFWFDSWHQEQNAYLWSGEFRQIRDDMPNYPDWDYPAPDMGVTWAETEVSGPTFISFLYSKYSGVRSPFTISVDGVDVFSTMESMNEGEPVWQGVEVPEGDHRVRLTFTAKDWFCGNATFNGIMLFDVRMDDPVFRPVVTPASTEDEGTATTFNRSLMVTITNGVPGSAIYYTLDGLFPDGLEEREFTYDIFRKLSLCSKYSEPFLITNSALIRAIAVMPDGSLTIPTSALFLERHAIEPGEWTADADGAVVAAGKNGNMIIAFRTASNNVGIVEEFENLVAVAESREFLDWARSNDVYLVRYADNAFEKRTAASYYNMVNASIRHKANSLVCANAWAPFDATFYLEWENDYPEFPYSSAYSGTASELIALLEGHLQTRPTVFFDATGGEVDEEERKLSPDSAVGALPTPSREKYKFLGWFTEVDGGAKVTARTKVTEDVTFYAHWEYDGSAMVTAAVAEGQEALGRVTGGNAMYRPGAKVALKATANKGAAFVGWFTNDVLVAATPSYSYVAGGVDDVAFEARFVEQGDDRLSVEGFARSLELKKDVSPLALGDCFVVDSVSVVTSLSISGLPSGVKYDAKTRTFSGAPTKAGAFYVTCTAKNGNGYQHSFTAVWTVGEVMADEDLAGIGGGALAQLDELVTGHGYELHGFSAATAVSGLPAGLKFDKKTGVIAGTPTKPGKATVTLTGANKAKTVRNVVVADGGMYALTLKTASHGGGGAAGTASGGGVYAVGKKVTLKATPAKGSVFVGWEDGSGSVLSQSASYAYVTTDGYVTLTAVFATVAEDAASIALSIDGATCLPEEVPSRTNWCGVAVGWPVEVDALSLPTVKAAGLPSGVKLVQDKATGAYSLSGAPTAASKADKATGLLKPSRVKLTVTTAGKSSKTYEFDWTILPLPDWAVGTFDGAMYEEVEGSTGGIIGLVQGMTVAANGKISGKLVEGAHTWTLSAPAFAAYYEASGAFVTAVVGKSGKEAFTNILVVSSMEIGDGVRGAAGMVSDGVRVVAFQNLWKTEPWKTTAKPFAKAPALAVGEVSLKFAASGAIPLGNDAYMACLYFPPNAKKGFGGHAAAVPLRWDGAAFSLAE